MSTKYLLLIGCGAIALAGAGYLLGRGQEMMPARPSAPAEAAGAETPTVLERKPEPPAEQVQLEVAMVAYSPQGCQMDPTGMGCASFPIPVVRITNKGEPLRLLKIAVNKRYNNPSCIVNIDKTVNTGDSWMSEGNPDGAADNPMGEGVRALEGKLVDFRKYCGDQIVLVDVATDKGVKQYEFGNR